MATGKRQDHREPWQKKAARNRKQRERRGGLEGRDEFGYIAFGAARKPKPDHIESSLHRGHQLAVWLPKALALLESGGLSDAECWEAMRMINRAHAAFVRRPDYSVPKLRKALFETDIPEVYPTLEVEK
jgi:hypothetical protein